MKNTQDIEKQAKAIRWVINSHKKQIEHHLQEDDFRKVTKYSQKIMSLQAELVLLEWVIEK